MPREVEPPLLQRDFLLAALQEKLRVDGRGLLEGREAKLVFGRDLGVVECSLGKTRCVLASLTSWLWCFGMLPVGAVFMSLSSGS